MNWFVASNIKLKPKPSGDPYQAISAINALGMINPLNNREYVIDGVKVGVRPYDDNTIWLNSIEAIEKGQGHGTAVLKKIIDIADANNVAVYLNPMPFGDTSSRQLVNWYTGMGFIRGQGNFRSGLIHYPKGSNELV